MTTRCFDDETVRFAWFSAAMTATRGWMFEHFVEGSMSDDQSPDQEIEFTGAVVPVRVEITPIATGVGMQIQEDDLGEHD